MRKSQFLKSVKSRLNDDGQLVSRDVTLNFVNCSTLPTANADSGILTVLTDCVSADHSFNEDVYRQHLNTRVLGNVVLYADVTTTTMNILDRSVPRSFH